MTNFDTLDDHLYSLVNADVLERASNCTKCGMKESVIETWQCGMLIGECTECGAHYLGPVYDKDRKDVI